MIRRQYADLDTTISLPADPWAIRSTAYAAPGTVSPLAVAAATVAGSTLVLITSRTSAADTFSAVTDDAGNVWQLAADAPPSGTAGRRIQVWTAKNAAPVTVVSAVFAGAGTAYATLLEIGGADPVAPVDVAAAEIRASATAPAALQVTPTTQDTLVIAAVMANPNTIQQISTPFPFTPLDTSTGGHKIAYLVGVPAGVAVGPTWTFVQAAGSGHAVIAIRKDA